MTEPSLRTLCRKRAKGVYAFCDDCAEQTFVDELEIIDGQVLGICNECLNSVTVERADLENTGKSF